MRKLVGIVAVAMVAMAGGALSLADKPMTRLECVEVIVSPSPSIDDATGIDELSRPFNIGGDPVLNGPGNVSGGGSCGAQSCSITCNGSTCVGGPCGSGFYAYCSCTTAGGCMGTCYKCPS